MTDYCEIEYTEKGVITKCDETHDKRAGTFILPGITVLEEFDTIESEDGRIGFGVYVPEESQIYVAGNVPQEIKLKALFHELAHWVQDISGIDFDEDTANEFAERLYNAMASEETHDKRTENARCVFIDRDAAIDVIHKYFMQKIDDTPVVKDEDGEHYITAEVEPILEDNKALSKAIKNLPAADVPEHQTLTEDDYAYCAECDHVEVCGWYPMYGCEFKSRPSAEPDSKESSSTHKALDTISRQAALDAIRPLQTYKLFEGDDMLLVDKADVQTELMKLPSTEPEQRWIPVSERLPEHNQRVLVSIFTPHKGANARSGTFYKKYFMNDNGDTWNATDEEVKAWLPLPEPYKGESE